MTKEKYIDVKKYRKGVKENYQRIADYLQKACVLCIDFHCWKVRIFYK